MRKNQQRSKRKNAAPLEQTSDRIPKGKQKTWQEIVSENAAKGGHKNEKCRGLHLR